MSRNRVDGLAIVAFALIFFMVYNVLRDRGMFRAVLINKANAASSVVKSTQPGLPDRSEDFAQNIGDPDAISAPYNDYFLTQGLHGFSYGQMAIDISAGKGAAILSPINGVVKDIYIDQFGNTTLIIENDHYQITMLHGAYTVQPGDQVSLGQQIGQESNQGLTYDNLGRLCQGRDCGYHTHLNVYDKQLGANVDPTTLIGN